DALAHAHFDRLLDLTAAPPVAGQPAADLTIWPETAVPYLLEQAPGALREMSMAAENRAVITGIQRTEGWRGWNSLAVLGPEGAVTAIYDKHHLVPFGEYIPFGDLVFRLTGIAAFAAQEGFGYTAGAGPAVLDLGPRLGRALPLICYEAVFPGIARAAPGRADWILQITNDAWFGTLTGPWQHYAQARLRATEQGLPLIRVANTGVTAVVDAHGRAVVAMGLGRRGFLDARLPGALPPTPYARWGELPVILVWLAGFAALLVWRRRPARP
ncbi:MAG TPA: apolipoprotein N-acyltransferase, partial [Paracoccaceae bacterium]|nr:apolipoprotein N-acyltransferase [Paracoccaceae bacterium]